MRSNEERIAEVKRRIEKREREERLHRSRITGICAVAASLVLIICLSFFIPDAASRNRNNSYSNYDMAASIFGNSEVLTKDIVEKVKAAYVAEGHTADSVKKIRVYIKPEEGMAYYVVNDDYASGISLF